MKKVLIIANLFHASPRVPGFATYLPEFGWKAKIITPQLGENAALNLGFPEQFLTACDVLETPFCGDIFWFWRHIFKIIGFKTTESITEQIKDIAGVSSKKSLLDIINTQYHTLFAYPDTEITWIKPALSIASKILQSEQFDAIISSSPFPTNHIIAAKLKKIFNLPWLADFRDLWSQNHNYPYGTFRKYFEEKLERKVLSSANVMVGVNPVCAAKQANLHKRSCLVIANGFDPNHLCNNQAPHPSKFTVSYTGTIYTGKQKPEKFLHALARLISNKKLDRNNIEVGFYGKRLNWLDNAIAKLELNDIVKQYGMISRHESLRKQRESHLLLMFNWENPEEGVYPSTKFFEYLSAQRPILSVGGSPIDDFKRLIMETGAGIYASTSDEIEAAIANFYEEFKFNGDIKYNGCLDKINKYSYRKAAAQFATILNEITQSKSF